MSYKLNYPASRKPYVDALLETDSERLLANLGSRRNGSLPAPLRISCCPRRAGSVLHLNCAQVFS
jgi:hypothetical protein